MNSSWEIAWELLLVGMLTIFAVLGLVVGIGHLLIRMVNAWTPNPPPTSAQPSHGGASIPGEHLAAIAAAVNWVVGPENPVQHIQIEKKS